MHDDYSRLLLPETTEIAFATICGEIERQMAADRLRKVLAPAVVRATGAEGEISFSHPGDRKSVV